MKSLTLIKHYVQKRAIGIFLVATIFLSALSYFIFDMYVSSVGQEIVGTWLQSEAIAIQEGNLLTSITKNQRVLLSSRFIDGMKLIDTSANPPTELIAFGQPLEVRGNDAPPQSEQLAVTRDGFLQKQILYRVPGRDSLILAAQVSSDFLSRGFFGVVAVLIGFLLIFITVIRRMEQRESVLREKVLKRALTEMVLTDQSSQYIQSEFPILAKWWAEKKSELENGRRLAIINEKNTALGELAARLAHDIRSPLNTLTSVSESVAKMNPAHERLFKMAVQRLREITGDIMQTYKIKSSSEINLSETGLSTVYLVLLVDEIAEEKQAQYHKQNLTFNVHKGRRSLDAISRISAGEFKRHLSNVMDNAAEAVMGRSDGGTIDVFIDADDEKSVVRVKDNGKGLPENLARQVGSKGFTFGKQNGSGFGLHFLKEAVSKLGGDFRFESRENEGSTVTVQIPREKAHSLPAVDLTNMDAVLILDDDPGIHESWRQLLIRENFQLPVEHAFDPDSAVKWLKSNSIERKIGVLTDFQLNHKLSGLDFVEQNRDRIAMSLLVTSSYNEVEVVTKAARLRVLLLPKPLLASVTIRHSNI